MLAGQSPLQIRRGQGARPLRLIALVQPPFEDHRRLFQSVGEIVELCDPRIARCDGVASRQRACRIDGRNLRADNSSAYQEREEEAAAKDDDTDVNQGEQRIAYWCVY